MTPRETIEVALAALLIGGGAWLYFRRGKADPNHGSQTAVILHLLRRNHGDPRARPARIPADRGDAMSGIDLLNLGIGLTALAGGLAMIGYTLRRHRRDEPRGMAMLIAGMMVTAFGLLITAFAVAFAFGGPANLEAAR